jgi:hypothetical protein
VEESRSGLTVAPGGGIPALSRQEAERIRMRLGDAEVVGRWLERAGRIKAPAAPPEGPLATNETGWLVTRGDLGAKLWPWSTGWAAAGGSAAAVLVLAVLKPLFKMSLRHAPVIAIAVAGAGLAAAYGLSRLVIKRKLARWRRTAVPFDGRDGAIAEGTLVRLTGRIVPQPGVPTLFRGRPAVLFRNRVGEADETRGHDFEVELAGGVRITIEVRDALLLDPLTRVDQPVCGPVHVLGTKQGPRIHSDLLSRPPFSARWARFHEASVGPSDTVEVIGTLARTPGLALYGTDEDALLVRSVEQGSW